MPHHFKPSTSSVLCEVRAVEFVLRFGSSSNAVGVSYLSGTGGRQGRGQALHRHSAIRE